MKVQIITVTEAEIMPGDVFKDTTGVVWMALNPGNSSHRNPLPATDAVAIWHTDAATRSLSEDHMESVAFIPGPLTMITHLLEVK